MLQTDAMHLAGWNDGVSFTPDAGNTDGSSLRFTNKMYNGDANTSDDMELRVAPQTPGITVP